jgi:hypothetical protein
MTHENRPRRPTTPMSDADPDTADPATADQDESPPRARPVAPEAPHGPGGMDAIEDDPVRAPDDDDAPGGMTGIPDPEGAPESHVATGRGVGRLDRGP